MSYTIFINKSLFFGEFLLSFLETHSISIIDVDRFFWYIFYLRDKES